VIVMRYFLEVSESEMADELKKPISTIKYWLRKAREQLKQLLKPEQNVQTQKTEQPIAAQEINEKEA
jgi:DNA-directed RNA polymerase specialized sigma24 family protein